MKISRIVILIAAVLLQQNQCVAQTKDVYEVCRSGDTTTLKAMLQQTPSLIDSKQSNGFTPLIIATYNGQAEISTILIQHGADVNAQDKAGNTALMGLCFNGNTALVKLLLNNKVAVNTLNFNHASALIFAATFGHVDIIKLLLKAGADKTVKDVHGKTALDQAMMQGNDIVVALLK